MKLKQIVIPTWNKAVVLLMFGIAFLIYGLKPEAVHFGPGLGLTVFDEYPEKIYAIIIAYVFIIYAVIGFVYLYNMKIPAFPRKKKNST